MRHGLKLILIWLFWWAFAPIAQAEQITELLQLAIANSPEVAKANAGLQVAKSDLKAIEANWLPQASARLYKGVGDTQQSNPLLNQRSGGENVENNSISIQQSIYNKPASVQLEKASLAVQEAQLRHTMAVQTVIQAWMNKLAECKQSDMALTLAKHKLNTALAQTEQIEQGIGRGENSALDLAIAETERLLREAEQGEARNTLGQKLWELSQLTGKTVEPSWIENLKFSPPTSEYLETDLEQLVLDKNLSLRIQHLYTKSAKLDIEQARGQHHPSLKFVAQHSQSQSETVSTLGNRVKQNVMALQMDIPLFNGFATQAQTEKAAANLNQQYAEHEKARSATTREAKASLRELNNALGLLAAYEHAVQTTEGQKQAINTAIQHKMATTVELRKVEEKLAELQARRFEQASAAMRAYVNIQALLGELVADKMVISKHAQH